MNGAVNAIVMADLGCVQTKVESMTADVLIFCSHTIN